MKCCPWSQKQASSDRAFSRENKCELCSDNYIIGMLSSSPPIAIIEIWRCLSRRWTWSTSLIERRSLDSVGLEVVGFSSISITFFVESGTCYLRCCKSEGGCCTTSVFASSSSLKSRRGKRAKVEAKIYRCIRHDIFVMIQALETEAEFMISMPLGSRIARHPRWSPYAYSRF